MAVRRDDTVAKALCYHTRLVAAARRWLLDKNDAEDVVQEVLVLVHQRKAPFESDEHLRAWLIRACRHRSISRNRSAVWRARGADPDMLADAAVSWGALDGSEDLAVLLSPLPNAQRQAVLLRYVAGMSVKEIAIAVKVPIGTVETRLKRALRTLRQTQLHLLFKK